jgi:hypothetical protein
VLKGATEDDGVAAYADAISPGDFDGDGVDGLVVGALFASTAYLISQVEWDAPSLYVQDVATVMDGVESTDNFGAGVTVADFDADGYDDWAIGAPAQDSPDWENVGYAYIFTGSAEPPVGLKTSDAYTTIRGQDAGLYFAASMAAGDTDADGKADLAAFQGLDDRESSVWIFTDIPSGTISTDSAVASFDGIRKANCGLTRNLALEDVNADGMADIICGCAEAGRSADALGDDEGMVSIFLTQGL